MSSGPGGINILIVTPEYRSGGGIATFYQQQARALVEAGAKVAVVEGSPMALGDGSTVELDGVHVTSVDRSRVGRMMREYERYDALPELKSHLAVAWAAAEQVDFGADFDLVETTDWGLLFVPFLVKGQVPLVAQGHASIGQIFEHDPVPELAAYSTTVRLMEIAFLRHAGTMQTYSLSNSAYWERELGQSVKVIYPAFAASEFRGQSVGPNGLVLGRLQRWKGPDIVCEALKVLGHRRPTIEWRGADVRWGDSSGPTSAYLAQVQSEVFGHSLLHRPPLHRADAFEAQSAARFNLVPSSWDVFNFTAVEGMASGRPTIVSSGAGASEIITHGTDGFVFEAGNVSSLAATVEQVMDLSDAHARQIGVAARETINRSLAPACIAQQRLAAYRSTIEEWSSKPRMSESLTELVNPSAKKDSSSSFLEAYTIRQLASHLQKRLVRRASGAVARLRLS